MVASGISSGTAAFFQRRIASFAQDLTVFIRHPARIESQAYLRGRN
jgi:hypothetical protein